MTLTKYSFNCFGSSMKGTQKNKRAMASESLKRPTKHHTISKDYAVQIVPPGGKPQALVRILSLSHNEQVSVPVRILSPIEKPTVAFDANIIGVSVTSQKSEAGDHFKVKKLDRGSWVRIFVSAMGLSKEKRRNGKVRHVSVYDPRETRIIDSPKTGAIQEAAKNVPRDSTTGSVDQQSCVAIDSSPSCSGKKKVQGFHSKVKAHASVLCSPMKSGKASTSYTRLPRSDMAMHNETLPTPINMDRLAGEGYDAAIGASVFMIVMLCLVQSDRVLAIVCTSMWCYAMAILRIVAKSKRWKLATNNPS